MPLTDVAIRNAKPREGKGYKLSDGGGLFLWIQTNAKRNNRSVSDFILTSAVAFAEEMLEQDNEEALSEEEWNSLYRAMIKPPKSYKALKRAFKEYRL